MHSYSIKSLIACTLMSALVVGCASPSSSPAVASSQRNVQSGKVVGVKSTAASDQSAGVSSSGGSSGGGTAAGGAPTILSVLFADGTQGTYAIERPTEAYVVGAPVQVITDGESITIVSP
jgi:hypothetical protein